MAKKVTLSKLYVKCIAVRRFMLNDLPEFTAWLDTGYSKTETEAILAKMYLKKAKYDRPPGTDEKRKKESEIYKWPWGLMLFKWEDAADDKSHLEDTTVKDLRFTYNWNNKLLCKTFTSIRMYNPVKYEVGNIYRVHWPGNKGLGEQATMFK